MGGSEGLRRNGGWLCCGLGLLQEAADSARAGNLTPYRLGETSSLYPDDSLGPLPSQLAYHPKILSAVESYGQQECCPSFCGALVLSLSLPRPETGGNGPRLQHVVSHFPPDLAQAASIYGPLCRSCRVAPSNQRQRLNLAFMGAPPKGPPENLHVGRLASDHNRALPDWLHKRHT